MIDRLVPALSRIVAVSDLAPSGTRFAVRPTPEERVALAALNNIVALDAMSADLLLVPEGMHGVHVTGEVKATVVQTCVVSLEPFESEVREPVDVRFLTPEALEKLREQRPATASEDDEATPDEPDVIEGGSIDVGALSAEHLTLGLDPYPRKPGAHLERAPEADDAPVSPFAVLRNLAGDRS